MRECMADMDEEEELGLQENESDEEIVNAPSFACCHLYRQCSDAKACVINDVARASLCAYKKNLDAGVIFYGKMRTTSTVRNTKKFLMRSTN